MLTSLLQRQFFVPLALCLFAASSAESAWARNPWASAVGEAYVAQLGARDIENRIKRINGTNPLLYNAMELDRIACTLHEQVKCGASVGTVQSLYGNMENYWCRLRVAIYSDPCLGRDRVMTGMLGAMDTRMRNLNTALNRVIERECRCAPYSGFNPGYGVPGSIQYQVRSGRPTIPNYGYSSPNPYPPGFLQLGFPQPSFPGSNFMGPGVPIPGVPAFGGGYSGGFSNGYSSGFGFRAF